MRAVETAITIKAPPQRVWEVLINFSRYPEWSSFIRRVDGVAELGTRLRVTLVPAGRRGVSVRPRVSAMEANRRFAWTGQLLHPALFSGTHQFLLEPLSDNETRLVHTEAFSGILSSLSRHAPKGAWEAFTDFNKALKARAESTTT